ncbi:hypothetical protein [Paenibacillus sp. XY044]|uniref:hypothetical protein n=1 Tax=Paenibacillus sp. XY044 TaxID=2026089 RepID=UPI000B98C3F7|nr:hypothetical protein [Paenibacillus sp. XY044]OZB98054.1 hypothetical protein CJP46_02490 [Paenibacillus sp. XY044]
MNIDQKQIEKMWQELKEVSFDEDYENQALYLAEDWKHFKEGTYQEEILQWFDENYSKGASVFNH